MTKHSSSSSRHSHGSRRSSDQDSRRSSSKHSRSTSSRQTRPSVEREQESIRTSKSRSTHSVSRSTTLNEHQSHKSASVSYGPDGQKRKRLVESTDSDNSSEEIAREQASRNPSFWTKHATKLGICAFLVGVVIAVATTFLLMKGNSSKPKKTKNNSNNNDLTPETLAPVEMVPTGNPTPAPTGMPTIEYPIPELEVCQALREGQAIQTIKSDLLERNMDISFDLTIRPGGTFRTEEELIEYFPNQVESVLIPTLAGCHDIRGFRKLGDDNNHDHRALLDDALQQIRYVIAGGNVSGTKYSEIDCPPENSGQLVSCFNVIVYFELFLNGDEAVFQVLSLITTILTDMSSDTLVSSLDLPNPPFQKVVANGVRNNDPTVSPSMSPTQFPTDRPSGAPSIGPTNKPSVPPTGAPSAEPSASPSGAPSMSPTKGPTKSPTPAPSKSPTTSPSSRPTGQPSPAPSASPSAAPSAAPSLAPSISNAPSLSAAPSNVPSISNAPTSRINYIIGLLPPSFTDTFTIDWLANIDTWWAPDDAQDEAAIWAERYTLILFERYGMTNFIRSGTSHCGWTNITCDADGRVVDLELPYNNIRGGIPTELAVMSELTKLDLSHNFYVGTTLPAELFSLINLEYLDLSSSGITGTIPRQISNMQKLREMHLNSNNLVGTIPRLPLLVQQDPANVVTLGNGVIVASVCEMYGNELQMTTVSVANGGGCDLVRTASDSSSSSSSSDDSSSSSAAPVTRFRYRSVFRRRGREVEEEEESSEDEDSFRKFASPVYNVRAPQAVEEKKRKNIKKLQHKALKKHTKRAKKHGFLEKTGKEMTAEFLKSEFPDEEE